ncbi:hypothetical protein EUGRSUZ_G02791 [Eucalyptus grandis]|uniref:Uncharacterized protein n=2 Tax=Eucalyptus grandis TaxID=71139 RepID=A0ACC3K7T1_EUCGR|nr:hypothetical protein EUGRSUZ_G02791 [Eucalyptus grandis]
MSNPGATKKASSENSEARLPPKRGQVKVRIVGMVVKKVAGIASAAGLGRKRSRVAEVPASAPLLKISGCSLPSKGSPQVSL